MQDNPRLGIALMIATTVVFAVQDGISRYLAENYNVITVVTIRYMFFMCFVLAYSSRQKGGIRQVASSGQLPLQIGRGLLLVAQICVAILSFSTVGLVNFHAAVRCVTSWNTSKGVSFGTPLYPRYPMRIVLPSTIR